MKTIFIFGGKSNNVKTSNKIVNISAYKYIIPNDYVLIFPYLKKY